MKFPNFSKIQIATASQLANLSANQRKLIDSKTSFKKSLEQQINHWVHLHLNNAYQCNSLYPFEDKFNDYAKMFFCREVIFYADDKPVAYARSILSLSNILNAFERKIINLGNEPMGPYIYQLNFERSPFATLKLEDKNKKYLGRSSIFSSNKSHLMISEIWPIDLFV